MVSFRVRLFFFFILLRRDGRAMSGDDDVDDRTNTRSGGKSEVGEGVKFGVFVVFCAAATQMDSGVKSGSELVHRREKLRDSRSAFQPAHLMRMFGLLPADLAQHAHIAVGGRPHPHRTLECALMTSYCLVNVRLRVSLFDALGV